MAESGQDSGQRRLQADRSPVDGFEEGRLVRFVRLAEVGFDGPGLLAVPLEPGPLGIAGRPLGQGEDFLEIAPVFALDDRLGIRIADVDVGMRQEPDLPRHHRLDRDLAAPDGAVVQGHLDRHGPLPVRGGQQELERVVAEFELEPGPLRFAAGDDRPPGRGQVADLDPDDLEESACFPRQGLFAPGPDVPAQIVAEDHEPVVRARRFARDPDPERPAREEERGRDLEPHEAEELVELIDHDGLERERKTVRPRLMPLAARGIGRRPEAQGRAAVDLEIEAMAALARRVAGQPDEGRGASRPVGRDGLGLPFDGHGPVRGPTDESGGDVGIGGMVRHLGAGHGLAVASEPVRSGRRGGRRDESQQDAGPPYRHEAAPGRGGAGLNSKTQA